ncbi:alkylhydroperoxidase [Vespertiliibacter pulmonis]|uniref:Putative peroxidase-related enzyme n=1 Tax=Vespertiliibacter pulmonis TaxID=1443036 RepID=A0A3N4W1Z6_9PAST|nr:carboxymuconolactone decarboxylase family protein [Vespertiliibacter pulmonis]QLB20808.1 alkylhydroperoxidase [Vespertiliibacter pulmonis]RPE83457.1 putative peroxidase-related enzyme [Vespertiliibacter pulmonis]
MTRLTIQTIDSAVEASAEMMKAVKTANGFLPNLVGVLANAPTALETYRTVGTINGRGSLTPIEREVVQITTAVTNGCEFCIAGHSAISTKMVKMPADILQSVRQGTTISDPKLEALAQFTRLVMAAKGNITDAQLDAFFQAGFTQQNVLDVLVGISVATLTNYANNLAKTPINPELQAFAP